MGEFYTFSKGTPPQMPQMCFKYGTICYEEYFVVCLFSFKIRMQEGGLGRWLRNWDYVLHFQGSGVQLPAPTLDDSQLPGNPALGDVLDPVPSFGPCRHPHSFGHTHKDIYTCRLILKRGLPCTESLMLCCSLDSFSFTFMCL